MIVEILEHDVHQNEFGKEIITDTIEQALSKLGIKSNQILEVIFVKDREIQDLNQEYRRINKPTDVLSFPQSQTPSESPSILGSIVISLETVNKKNESLPDVIKHGLLHLLGYDHETNQSEWAQAAKIINAKL